jgi:hypothetical protein
MNGDNAPKEFQIYPWGKENDEVVKNTLGREKPMGESETSVLGKLIPWRNKESPPRGLEPPSR